MPGEVFFKLSWAEGAAADLELQTLLLRDQLRAGESLVKVLREHPESPDHCMSILPDAAGTLRQEALSFLRLPGPSPAPAAPQPQLVHLGGDTAETEEAAQLPWEATSLGAQAQREIYSYNLGQHRREQGRHLEEAGWAEKSE